jgi:ribosomal-protein-alanine N-acetyltransferase
MILRSATENDLEALAILETLVFGGQAWSRESVEGELSQLGDTRSALVADFLGEIVGYVVLMVIAGTADLTRIAVAPDHRRNGLGRELIDEAISEAASRGCEQVMLEVAADNVAAVNLYVDKGFREVTRRERYYAGDIDAIVMRRLLVETDATPPGVGDGMSAHG